MKGRENLEEKFSIVQDQINTQEHREDYEKHRRVIYIKTSILYHTFKISCVLLFFVSQHTF